MEPTRLSGNERREWEQRAIRRTAGARQALFRVILDHAAGKAFCWPSNATIGDIVGVKLRAVVYGIRALEAAGMIRTIARNDLPGRRMIVLLGHPGTAAALQYHASRKRGIATEGQVDPMSPIAVALQLNAKKDRNESEKKSGPVGRSDQPPDRPVEDDGSMEPEHLAAFRRFFGHLPGSDPEKIQD